MSSNVTKLTDIVLDAGIKGFDKINRMTILHVLTNMPTANVTIKYNLKVKNYKLNKIINIIKF